MWWTEHVYGEDFMAFKRLDLPLGSMRGITLIEGKRAGAGSSNGAGKSSVLDLIHWTLYGTVLRKARRVEKIIRRHSTTGVAVGRVTLQVDGRQVIVERVRSKSGVTLNLLIDGDDASKKANTIAGMQARLDGMIGSEREFDATVMFSGALSKFCQMTDAERKSLLEHMTGSARYVAAGVRAKAIADAAQAVIDRTQATLANGQERLDGIQQLRADMVATNVHAWCEKRLTRPTLVRKLHAAFEATIIAQRALRVFYGVQAAEKAKRDEAVAAIDVKLVKVEREQEMAQRDLASHDSDLAASGARITDLEDDLKRMHENDHPERCPHCGQRWPKDDKGGHLETAIAEKEAKIQELRSARAPVERQRLLVRERKAELVNTRRELTQERNEAAGEETDGDTERRLLADVYEREGAGAEAGAALVELDTYLAETEPLSPDLSRLDAQRDDVLAGLAQARAAQTEATTTFKLHDFWKRGFSRSGFPSFLIDASIPRMNEMVGKLAADLSDGELRVYFDPAAAKGRGDIFAVQVDYANGSDDYDMTSTGEHARVDVPVLFAISDLVASQGRSPCRQLFLDELLNGTDKAFGEAFLGMLRTHFPERDVFMISHDDEVKTLCDGSFLVRKRADEAEIVLPGGAVARIRPRRGDAA